jgi:hypothetical protein
MRGVLFFYRQADDRLVESFHKMLGREAIISPDEVGISYIAPDLEIGAVIQQQAHNTNLACPTGP